MRRVGAALHALLANGHRARRCGAVGGRGSERRAVEDAPGGRRSGGCAALHTGACVVPTAAGASPAVCARHCAGCDHTACDRRLCWKGRPGGSGSLGLSRERAAAAVAVRYREGPHGTGRRLLSSAAEPPAAIFAAPSIQAPNLGVPLAGPAQGLTEYCKTLADRVKTQSQRIPNRDAGQ